MRQENDNLCHRTRPQLKKEVVIDRISPAAHIIHVFASPDAIEDMRVFGKVYTFTHQKNLYQIWVDGRYDFDEVVEYIRTYGTIGK